MNPTALTIIKKGPIAPKTQPRLACPRYGDLIREHTDCLYSPGSLRANPMILGIPCLSIKDGVVASQYEACSICDAEG